MSEQVYLTELTVILAGRPGCDVSLLKAYYEEELQRLWVFIGRYGFLYQCYQLQASDLDDVLFLRDAGASGMLLPTENSADREFSTDGNFLWGKFIAYDRLREWLEAEIRGLSGTVEDAVASGGPFLKWTGESIHLVELAYGIWLTGPVNHGQVSVTELLAWLEPHFQVKIGDAHRKIK